MPLERHWERQNAPLRPTTARERRTLLIALAVLAAATVAIVLYLAIGSPGARAGCVTVTLPSSTGAGRLQRCGSGARAWCAQERQRPDAIARAVLGACRRAAITAPRAP